MTQCLNNPTTYIWTWTQSATTSVQQKKKSTLKSLDARACARARLKLQKIKRKLT